MNITISQNTTNLAISQYKNFFFDKGMVTVAGKTYGLECSRLCLFGGDSDVGSGINASIQTGMTQLSGSGEKKVRSFYVSGLFDSSTATEMFYAMDGLNSANNYTSAPTSRIGAGGGGGIKFQGVRAKHGEFISAIVKNVNGARFVINNIIAFIIKGCRR